MLCNLLPDDLFLYIVCFLEVKFVCRLEQVCHTFKQVLLSNWKNLYRQNWAWKDLMTMTKRGIEFRDNNILNYKKRFSQLYNVDKNFFNHKFIVTPLIKKLSPFYGYSHNFAFKLTNKLIKIYDVNNPHLKPRKIKLVLEPTRLKVDRNGIVYTKDNLLVNSNSGFAADSIIKSIRLGNKWISVVTETKLHSIDRITNSIVSSYVISNSMTDILTFKHVYNGLNITYLNINNVINIYDNRESKPLKLITDTYTYLEFIGCDKYNIYALAYNSYMDSRTIVSYDMRVRGTVSNIYLQFETQVKDQYFIDPKYVLTWEADRGRLYCHNKDDRTIKMIHNFDFTRGLLLMFDTKGFIVATKRNSLVYVGFG